MFDFVRNHRRWLQFILLLLILPSFVFVGVEGYTSFINQERNLAKVGDVAVSKAEFDQAQRAQLDQIRRQFGTGVDPSLFDTPDMRRRLLDSLIDTRLIAQEAAQSHFSATDQRLRDAILAIPQIQENGAFSRDRYMQALAAQGLTVPGFEAQMRNDLALRTVTAPVASSAVIPATVFDGLMAAQGQRREVRLQTLSQDAYAAQAKVTDEDVKKYYDSNTQAFSVPESVDAQYVVLDEKSASAGITVSEDDVKSYYQQNLSRFGEPEQRRASHILLTFEGKSDRAALKTKADALAEQARAKPEEFAALAKANSQDPGSAGNGGDLDWFGRGMMVKPFEDAVFSMKEGEVSAPIESDFGYHIIKLVGVRPGNPKPLTEVRGQIENEIRQQKAAARYAALAQDFTNTLYDQSDSLDPVAQKLDLKVQTMTGVTRAPSGQPKVPGISDNPKVLEALFSDEVLNEKRNSGAIETATGTLVAVRLIKREPAHVAPLEQVSAQIRTQLTRERAVAAAREAGEARLTALKAKDDMAGFGPARTVSRLAPGEGVAPVVLAAIMRADASKLPTYVGVETDNGYVIGRISKVEAPAPVDPQVVDSQRQQLAERIGVAEEAALMRALRAEHKVSLTPEGEAAIQGRTESN